MSTQRERRIFCDALGIKLEQVRAEKIADPDLPGGTRWRVSHEAFGAGEHADQDQAWHRFFDAAEKAPPLPLRCQATTKSGAPCKSAPQAGQRFCGPHCAEQNQDGSRGRRSRTSPVHPRPRGRGGRSGTRAGPEGGPAGRGCLNRTQRSGRASENYIAHIVARVVSEAPRMVNAISIGHNPLIPGAVDAAPAAQPKPVVAGFDPAGQALPDAQVWSTKIGSRALDTADGIDGWERKALLKTAQKSPQEFLQRLLADSKNGTPVELSFTRELSVGVLRVEFKAVDGKFDSTASIDVFNKKVDGFLKPYMAQDARDKGARAKIALGVKGELTEAGGVDDLQLEIKATNVPRFSVSKLLELDTFKKDLEKALGADTSKKAKQDEVMSLVGSAINKLADVPLPFLMKLINDSDVIKAELTSKGHDGRATVKVGGGNFSVGLRDVIGKDKSEPDIRLSLTGRSKNGGDTVQVDELRVFNQDKLAIEFAGSTPVLSRIKKNGEREAVNDHLGEAMAYLPMALALAGDKGVL